MATIDTNMSLVMIDPNEPLELYDGTIIKGRLEWFLYALCCLDYGNLPTPLSRIEEWANALITNELPNMEPQSRAEEFFKAILTGDTSNLPTPQSRSEVLLDKLARGENDFTNVEKIQSRYEFLLAYLIKNGGGIGNIDYVLYKFQKEDETLYNTKERPVKSAILKGKTLVNVYDYKTSTTIGNVEKNDNIVTLNASGGWIVINNKVPMLKTETTYTVIVNIISNTLEYNNTYNNYALQVEGEGSNSGFTESYQIPNGSVGLFKKVLKTKTQFSHNNLSDVRISPSAVSGSIKFTYMIIEGDYTNVDIPYFEGMQSVKMPVLTTTGKNLLDIRKAERRGSTKCSLINNGDGSITLVGDGDGSGEGILTTTCYAHLKQGKTYTFSFESDGQYSNTNATDTVEAFLLKDGSASTRIIQMKGFTTTFTCLEDGDYYVRFDVNKNDTTHRFWNVQLTEGSTVYPYEPYKSNILTVNEEVELRGVGDVQDTLDCLTGEYTEAIYEYTFTGDESWQISGGATGGYSYFSFPSRQLPIKFNYKNETNIPISCDKLPTITHSDFDNGLKNVGINLSYFFRLNFSDCDSNNGATVEDLKAYLKANPTTVQYPISKSVKTVDLSIVDQGGATIPKLNTFDKITHVNVSATDILPEVEMEVATTIGEDLSGTLYSTMEDIETKQEALKESNNDQTESINSTMMATTEIYESLL